MRRLVKTIVVALMMLTATVGYAQNRKDAFWVIEGNPSRQRHVVVRYYAGDRRLLGEERIAGRWINLSRARNIRALDKKLQRRVDADSVTRMAALKGKD